MSAGLKMLERYRVYMEKVVETCTSAGNNATACEEANAAALTIPVNADAASTPATADNEAASPAARALAGVTLLGVTLLALL